MFAILYSVSSHTPMDNISGFMPSLFVSILFVFLHIFMLHFLQGGGEGGIMLFSQGPPVPSTVSPVIDTSARARVTLLRARSRRAAVEQIAVREDGDGALEHVWPKGHPE